MKQAAVKKEKSFSIWQDLVKSEDELQLAEVRNLEEEACEIVESTKTEDHVDVLLQGDKTNIFPYPDFPTFWHLILAKSGGGLSRP